IFQSALVLSLLGAATVGLRRMAPQPLGMERIWDGEPGGKLAQALLWGVALAWLLPLAALFGKAVAPFQVQEMAYWGRGLLWELLRCSLVALLLVFLGWRLALRPRRVAWLLFLMPLFLPGSLPGLALQEAVQHHLPDWFIARPLLLSLAQGTRFAGIALLFGILAATSLPAAEAQAAQLLPPGRRRWWILLPRSLAMLTTATIILMVLLLGEVECAVLLAPAGYVLPSVGLHQFLHFRFDAQAAQLSVALAVVCMLLAMLLARLGRGLR
ncbi:MAG: hypothetical protein V3T77_00385, partial [Planctomycetota bacterium]